MVLLPMQQIEYCYLFFSKKMEGIMVMFFLAWDGMQHTIIPESPVYVGARLGKIAWNTQLNWISDMTYQTLLLSFRISARHQSFPELLCVSLQVLRILFEFQNPEVVPEENHQTCYSLCDSFLSRHCA